MARSRTSARPVVVGAVLVLAAALSGCSATNDITSQSVYSASDGVRATLGDLTAENLLIVAEAADAVAVWRSLILLSSQTFPRLPLVGYESGNELAAALDAGFEIGDPLRVWVRARE